MLCEFVVDLTESHSGRSPGVLEFLAGVFAFGEQVVVALGRLEFCVSRLEIRLAETAFVDGIERIFEGLASAQVIGQVLDERGELPLEFDVSLKFSRPVPVARST